MIGQRANGGYKKMYQTGSKIVVEARQKAGATLVAKFADLANAQAFYRLITL